MIKFMGYDFEVLCKKGTKNCATDALSRRPKLSDISKIKSKL